MEAAPLSLIPPRNIFMKTWADETILQPVPRCRVKTLAEEGVSQPLPEHRVETFADAKVVCFPRPRRAMQSHVVIDHSRLSEESFFFIFSFLCNLCLEQTTEGPSQKMLLSRESMIE